MEKIFNWHKKPESLREIYSDEEIYFPISKQKIDPSECKHYIEGIGHVIEKRPCEQPYVFHAMPSPPEGDYLQTRRMRNIQGHFTKGHQDHVFAYLDPKNNIAANNDIQTPERDEMKKIEGEAFYNLVFKDKKGIQKIIRMGSRKKDGYLTVVDAKSFDEIKRYAEPGSSYFLVHQAVSPTPAKIIDTFEIKPENSCKIFGFYHFNEFEYVPGLSGVIPLEEYLKKCSDEMQKKLRHLKEKIFSEGTSPLPNKLAQHVEKNRKTK